DLDFEIFAINGLGHLAYDTAGADHGVTTLDGGEHGLLRLEALLLRAENQEPEDQHQQQDRHELDKDVSHATSRRGTGGLGVGGRYKHEARLLSFLLGL